MRATNPFHAFLAALLLGVVSTLPDAAAQATRPVASAAAQGVINAPVPRPARRPPIPLAQRLAAGARFLASFATRTVRPAQGVRDQGQGNLWAGAGAPHYFGPYPNWAYSPLPGGEVLSIAVDNGGSGYTNPVVLVEDVYADVNDPAHMSGAVVVAKTDPQTGAIVSVQLQSGGAGYTLGSTPRVVVVDPSGSGAQLSASVGLAPGAAPAGGLRKFVDSLPGLGPLQANNIGRYIPVAVPDRTRYPGCDYYEIALVEYFEQLHSDLPGPCNPVSPGSLGTRMRGYVQEHDGMPLDKPHMLGPMIFAERDRPVRIRFTNRLPVGGGGELFLPVDKSVMGSGPGPANADYAQNRANLHLHGNNSIWISDGTPHQWTTPAGEQTQYPHGVSVYNVPDMPDAGPDPQQGVLTYYYTNQHSARLMFYHDHSHGITRLNVLAGEAAGYLLSDAVERDLVDGSNHTGVNPEQLRVLPGLGTPLIIQDRTFVDAQRIGGQDPTWSWGLDMYGRPETGSLWYPHVYMPNQNPGDVGGMNAFGRWHYGPWFYPPADITHPPVANPYYDCGQGGACASPWEPPLAPDIPNPSMPGEAFLDTPLVNGTAYPYLEVDPKAYRFRILNAANDRFFNLQLYVADESTVSADGRRRTEVKMVPAVPTKGHPELWPTDGRDGGVPDPALRGPAFVQIGTEGGFLPKPVVVENQPVSWNLDQTNFDMGLVKDHALFLGSAERADVVVDFSAFAGKTLILYNDSPAPVPALDARYDYRTGGPDLGSIGGAPTTQIGYGPNTRTIMQFRVREGAPQPFDLAALERAFAKTAQKRGVFEVSQDEVVVPQAEYDSAYGAQFPQDQYARIHEAVKSFRTVDGRNVAIPFQPKAIQDEMGETFDMEYGRMSSMLGLQLQNAQPGFATFPYSGPPLELLSPALSSAHLGTLEDGTQLWRVTHNGVDTHPIHTHLFNVQVVNRVAWDNAVRPPDLNELGWKETVRINPLQDTILAVRPVLPSNLPFKMPNSVRLLDPALPEGAWLVSPPPAGFIAPNGNPVVTDGMAGMIRNHYVNHGWEYVWHCHILAHEEMDMMHTLAFAVPPEAPSGLSVAHDGLAPVLSWTDESISATGFLVERSLSGAFDGAVAQFAAPASTWRDTTAQTGVAYHYRVKALNTVGDTQDYGPGGTFPVVTASSGWSAPAYMPAHQPEVQLSTGSMAFGPQRTHVQGAAASVTLANAGDATLVCALALSGANAGDFQLLAGGSVSVPAGGTAEVQAAFTPGAAGARSARLDISSNDPKSPHVAVLLGGTGIEPRAVLAPAAIDFGAWTIGKGSTPRTATLSNLGSDTLTWSAAAGGANAADFAVLKSCGNQLAPGDSCEIAVGFTPSAAGARTGSLIVLGDDPANPTLAVALAGTGTLVPGATDLSAVILAQGRIGLSFTDASTLESNFIVWRSVNGGMYLPVAIVPRTPAETAATGGVVVLEDAGAVPGALHAYFVVASDGLGQTAASNTATLSLTVPVAPAGLVVTGSTAAGDSTQASLLALWNDMSTNESGFELQRATDAAFAAPDTCQLAANSTSCTQLVPGNRDYYYRVRARNVLGASAWSATVLVAAP